MKALPTITLFLLLSFFAPLSAETAGTGLNDTARARFNGYWYPNGAEISRYRLEQARYGGIHEGDAVLIFVTESLNPATQIKADRPSPSDVPVLKLNATRKFFTGIYPYSTLTSVFTPVDAPDGLPLKLSTSVQEWCGQVYQQLNLQSDGYRLQSHSYFEGEGDQDALLGRHMPEDGLWNQIRTAPGDLPVGSVRLIPSAVYNRFVHRETQPADAVGSVEPDNGQSLEGRTLLRYDLAYQSGRRLVIAFEEAFPHRIQWWEESYPDRDGQMVTTRAVRTHTLMVDYWNRHDPADRVLLKQLGLDARP
jgi:hypothetical protein